MCLQRESSANKVDIWKCIWIDFSCIIKIQFSFRIIYCLVCLFGFFIYLAKADALKSADSVKSRSKTTNSGKHIKIFYTHKASALYLLLSPHILITGSSDCSSARSSVVSSTHIAFCSCSTSCSVSFLKLSSLGTRANVLPLSQFI